MNKPGKFIRVVLLFCLTLGMLVTPRPAGAATFSVCPSGCPYSVIASALNAAAAGDTISVAAGTYSEHNIEIGKNNISIVGAGSGSVIVDGTHSDRVFIIDSGITASISGMTITHGRVNDPGTPGFNAAGGGIENLGTLSLNNVILTANNIIGNNNQGKGHGGGIYSQGDLTMTNSQVTSNTAEAGGGGIYAESGTIQLTKVLVQGNGISAGNIAGGGGIQAWTPGSNLTTITLDRVTVDNNTATSMGAGIHAYANITITNSTISNNHGTNGAGLRIIQNSILSMTNDTVAGNVASYAPLGGGGMEVSSTATLTNVTISGNSAPARGGGIANDGIGKVNIQDSLIAGNTASSGNDDCYGTLTSLDYNLIGDGSTGCTIVGTVSHNKTNLSAKLGALAANGGATKTMDLLPGSPAIDAGNDATCASKDQRAITRPQGSHCDIGAYELEQSVLTFKSSDTNDGWILESAKGSGVGGSMNSSATTFQLGDDASNRQYRTILSFNTASVPDNANIVSAVLKIKASGSPTGSNPFSILGSLYADIKKGSFGSSSALQVTDFNAAPTTSKVGTFGKIPVGGWYTATLISTGRSSINKTSLTQFRLYFSTATNANNKADFMKFLSGNSSTDQAELVIRYSLP